MTWKTWAAALSLGAALTAAPPAAQAFDRLDGSATSAVVTDKTVDLLDLYAWMDPANSGTRMYLAMTVGSQINRTTDRFSETNLYVFHTNARQNATDTSPDKEVNVICKFDNTIGTQGFQCWVGNEYVKGKVNATGQSSKSGAFTVFAGPRNDPFFLNDAGLTAGITAISTAYNAGTKDVAKCQTNITVAQSTNIRAAFNSATPMVAYRTQNTLAIVVSIDPLVLMPGTKKVLSVWASTNKPQG